MFFAAWMQNRGSTGQSDDLGVRPAAAGVRRRERPQSAASDAGMARTPVADRDRVAPINAHHRAEADLARPHQVAGSFVPCEDRRPQIVLQQATAAPTAQISSAVARAPRAMSAEANVRRVARHAAHAAQQAAGQPRTSRQSCFLARAPSPTTALRSARWRAPPCSRRLRDRRSPVSARIASTRLRPARHARRALTRGGWSKFFVREDPRIISWSPTGRSSASSTPPR